MNCKLPSGDMLLNATENANALAASASAREEYLKIMEKVD